MFKTRYESSANTCRFRGCPRATDGYSTKQLLEEHEGSHTGGIKCAEPSCSFSRIGFKNSAGLKRHTNEYHATPETIIKPAVVRRQFVCGGNISEGTTPNLWGCARHYARQDELNAHYRSPLGRRCTRQYVEAHISRPDHSTMIDSIPPGVEQALSRDQVSALQLKISQPQRGPQVVSTFSFDDNVTLNSNILDTPSIMSPTSSTQDMFSPDMSLWEDFPAGPFADRTSTNSNTNYFFEQNNNLFARLPATQAATYGQQPSAWPLSDNSGSRTPTATKPLHAFGQADFDSSPPSSFIPVGSHLASFDGLPLHNDMRPSSVFPSTRPEQPLSPHDNTEWMALTAPELELESRPGLKRMRPDTPPPSFLPQRNEWTALTTQESELQLGPKRMRPNTPPRSFFPPRDGIRKKNARFEI